MKDGHFPFPGSSQPKLSLNVTQSADNPELMPISSSLTGRKMEEAVSCLAET